MADLAAWRALVDKELAGAPFDKLVAKTPEGAIEPLYVAGPEPGPNARGVGGAFQICMRVARGDGAAELDQGADAVWCGASDRASIRAALSRGKTALIELDGGDPDDTADDDESPESGEIWSSFDLLGDVTLGRLPVSVLGAPSSLPAVVEAALADDPTWKCIRICTIGFHDAGADAADELALGLSSLVAALRTLDEAKLPIADIGPLLWAQVAVGRDTFGELCKLRALRVLWHRVLAAAGVKHTALDAIHAVCSSRTISVRDPWVNMLRVTTQVFAAALGGAQLITPLPFDEAFASPSALGQRVARNTGLILRDESFLGRVVDAAGGSYYLESRTDALARAAWSRFQDVEQQGGVVAMLRTGALQARLEAAWQQRVAAIAKRKEPVLGVSEFANLREQLPGTPEPPQGVHRDSEALEALRAKGEAAAREVALIQLGPPGEHRARTGFAESFFAVAGLTARPGTGTDIAVLCGSDERYAAEAATTVKALKTAGARRVVLAGRPGALEDELRAAGVDAFIFIGCDVVATLEELL